jgi:hypothetical protein
MVPSQKELQTLVEQSNMAVLNVHNSIHELSKMVIKLATILAQLGNAQTESLKNIKNHDAQKEVPK